MNTIINEITGNLPARADTIGVVVRIVPGNVIATVSRTMLELHKLELVNQK